MNPLTGTATKVIWAILRRLYRNQYQNYDRKLRCISLDTDFPPHDTLVLAGRIWALRHKSVNPPSVDEWAFQVYNIAVELDADAFVDLVPFEKRNTVYRAFRKTVNIVWANGRQIDWLGEDGLSSLTVGGELRNNIAS